MVQEEVLHRAMVPSVGRRPQPLQEKGGAVAQRPALELLDEHLEGRAHEGEVDEEDVSDGGGEAAGDGAGVDSAWCAVVSIVAQR